MLPFDESTWQIFLLESPIFFQAILPKMENSFKLEELKKPFSQDEDVSYFLSFAMFM
jgi:hypothetical protein